MLLNGLNRKLEIGRKEYINLKADQDKLSHLKVLLESKNS